MSAFEVCRDPVLGEEVWLATTSRGLPLRVVPTDRFKEAAAVVSVQYGSTDLGFVRADGSVHRSPEGVAHYLEHKLFEDEELQAFDRFARRGARVNAMTGFAQTTYYFTATEQLAANLTDLLHLVSRAHITDANVEKERGIIAQEIRMYEDSADYRGFFDFLGCLYREHPVRHPVGGTVESIAAVTAEELLACYAAFYRTGNAALAVAGPVDPEEVLGLAESCALASGEPPARHCPEDLGPVAHNRTQRRFEVSRPRVLVGFKDRSLPQNTDQRLQRGLTSRILLDSLFGPSSDLREDLRRQGLADDTLSASYLSEPSFGVTAVGCECDDPEATGAALRDVMLDSARAPLDEGHLERVRRKVLGGYVRSFASVKGMAFAHAKEALERVPPFGNLERVQAVTLQDLNARRAEHFHAEAFAEAVVDPRDS
ncbi:MAG: insulinase family protein [Planctomycetes bacterium]|nr:insulinase family protein [Planctomycetota bacterium]